MTGLRREQTNAQRLCPAIDRINATRIRFRIRRRQGSMTAMPHCKHGRNDHSTPRKFPRKKIHNAVYMYEGLGRDRGTKTDRAIGFM